LEHRRHVPVISHLTSSAIRHARCCASPVVSTASGSTLLLRLQLDLAPAGAVVIVPAPRC
jgi:hypothetical protein